MIRVIIIDDEEPARSELRFLLEEEYEDIEIIAEASDGKMALKLCQELNPDLIFIDIQMPLLSGIDVAEALTQSTSPPYIIFVTAYDSHAIKAFKLHAIDYLLKPIETERLKSSIERVKKLIESDKSNSITSSQKNLKELFKDFKDKKNTSIITVCKDEKFYPVPIDKIKYAYADDKKTFLVTVNGKFYYKHTLQHLEEILPENFVRTHKSYIVNINFIKNIELWFNGAYQIFLQNEEEPIPLSRNHVKHFKEIMQME